MTLRFISPPTGLLVSLQEMRAHLVIDEDEAQGGEIDALIAGYTRAAQDHAERVTGRLLSEPMSSPSTASRPLARSICRCRPSRA